MSEFAFFRFRSNNMLSVEEERHKDEIIGLTEEVLEAKGNRMWLQDIKDFWETIKRNTWGSKEITKEKEKARKRR